MMPGHVGTWWEMLGYGPESSTMFRSSSGIDKAEEKKEKEEKEKRVTEQSLVARGAAQRSAAQRSMQLAGWLARVKRA